MKNLDVARHKQKIDSIIKLCSGLDNETVKSHMARYLCVLISGFVEESLRILLVSHASKRCNPGVSSFIRARLSDFTNAKVSKIERILGEFQIQFPNTETHPWFEASRDAINGIVENRHKIAHGTEIGIGLSTVLGYYREVLRFVSHIESQLE